LQLLVNIIVLSSIYALIACGYVLIIASAACSISRMAS